MNRSILRDLGFVGLESIENSIMAGLVTGDPVLLVGTHGSAKTALVRTLAEAMGLEYWAYDSSKALFEDMIGFPDPGKLLSGSVDYVPTPLSIWDKEFILIDEISRAAPSMQNKWLEVIRSRQVMGKPLASLKFIFAAMNPPGYLGAYPLDTALASRFAFIIEMPEAKEMDDDELKDVITTVTHDDASMARKVITRLPEYRCIKSTTRTGKAIQELIEKARAELPRLYKSHGPRVSEYVKLVSLQLRLKEIHLDGRRLGMIYRNILGVLAVEKSKGAKVNEEELLFDTLLRSLPLKALGMEVSNENFYPCHYLAYQSAFEGSTSCKVALAGIVGKSDILKAIQNYQDNIETLNEEDHHEVLNYIIERFKAAQNEEKAKPFIALLRFIKTARHHNGLVPPDVIARALEQYRNVTGISLLSANEYQDLIEDEDDGIKVNFDDPCENLCLRLSIEINRESLGSKSYINDDSVKATYQKLIEVLRPLLTREFEK
ncbi:MAG: MoxR family ATPase [Deltaproteobacteria bacterium]|nr:MoxR family ATPase [Deltaproteobacteria bacterium]